MKQAFYKVLATIVLFSAIAFPAQAAPECTPTPSIATLRHPGAAAIPSTNNLLLPTGKSIESDGQRLIFHGQMLDKQCKPVPDAVVEIWHLNPYGKPRLADKSEIATPYPAFAGAGRTVTDSDGRFTFTTAFPGVGTYWLNKRQYVVRAPQINMRIIAPGMKDFNTVVYFENDRRNANDPAYKRLSIERRTSVTMNVTPEEDNLYGTIQLVLPAYAQYRSY